MVVHAETLKTDVTAMYSLPARPLQFSYEADGMQCEFTLMTIGDAQSASISALSKAPTRQPSARSTPSFSRGPELRQASDMPPPRNSPAEQTRQLGRRVSSNEEQVQTSKDPESLFVAEEDERQWQPVDEQQEEQDMLGWDASGQNVSS